MKVEALLGSIGNKLGNDAAEELLLRARGKAAKALQRIRRPRAAMGIVKSPLGDLLIAISARGIVLNYYLQGDGDFEATIEKLRLEFDPVKDQRAVGAVGDEVRRYLAGDGTALRQQTDLTLAGTPFQQKILQKLRTVPRGSVISYQGLGAAVGVPNAARAVGNALHNNPVPIYIPCHRVISSDGRIGGYGGGAARKILLLRTEGFRLNAAQARIPDSVVCGHKETRVFCRITCRTAAHADRARILFFADPGQAERAGMRPCKLCRPA